MGGWRGGGGGLVDKHMAASTCLSIQKKRLLNLHHSLDCEHGVSYDQADKEVPVLLHWHPWPVDVIKIRMNLDDSTETGLAPLTFVSRLRNWEFLWRAGRN